MKTILFFFLSSSLINGIPCTQIELKTLDISPRRAMQQIVDYKADPGNGYTNSLLAFMQLFIVSNSANTYYFANNNNKHFAFDAKERKQQTYKEQLAPLADKRIAIIFDECHRSQFGDNQKAIKDFFPNSQLFGFTGTPIFETNATVKKIDGEEATYKTTADRKFNAVLATASINDAIAYRELFTKILQAKQQADPAPLAVVKQEGKV